MFYMLEKYPASALKHNSNHEKQVLFLMIPNRKEWHYLAVKKLSTLLRGINQKIMVIFVVWIVSIPLKQKTNLNRMNNVVKLNIFVM